MFKKWDLRKSIAREKRKKFLIVHACYEIPDENFQKRSKNGKKNWFHNFLNNVQIF